MVNLFEEIARAGSRQVLAALWEQYAPQGLWVEDHTLAAKARLVEVEAPRCRMCARSARWLETQSQYAAYCAGKACSNRDRICQNCGGPFVVNVDGAGSKYCSTDCKAAGYHPTSTALPGRVACAWCGASKPAGGYRANAWDYLCEECLKPIKRVVHTLKSHHVSQDRARLLRDDPRCEVCGTDLLATVYVSNGNGGKPITLLVVDHDHDCCPADSRSCGQCVRGLICRGCNSAAGLLKDSADSARSLAAYLDRWRNR